MTAPKVSEVRRHGLGFEPVIPPVPSPASLAPEPCLQRDMVLRSVLGVRAPRGDAARVAASLLSTRR
jgi:hypothetical protein